MPRWLVLFIVALVLPCYGFAAAGQSLVRAMDDPKHAAAHLMQEAHHHHDDGSFHQDDSQESAKHVADDCMGCAALTTATVEMAVAVFPDTVPGGLSLHPPSTPFLEGLRRPPRSADAI
jgi:hypothetical protein